MKDINFSFNQKTFLSHGWLNIPRAIIEYFNARNYAQYGILEAMVTIILHVNYSQKSYRIKGKTVNCNRAESVRSYTDWAKIFHWSRARTKRYFQWLESIGYIQFIDDPNCCSHFAVSFYDEFIYGPNFIQPYDINDFVFEADSGSMSKNKIEFLRKDTSKS